MLITLMYEHWSAVLTNDIDEVSLNAFKSLDIVSTFLSKQLLATCLKSPAENLIENSQSA